MPLGSRYALISFTLRFFSSFYFSSLTLVYEFNKLLTLLFPLVICFDYTLRLSAFTLEFILLGEAANDTNVLRGYLFFNAEVLFLTCLCLVELSAELLSDLKE